MKVFICTDIEGVAGVTSFENQAAGNGRYYESAKKLLTGEINAAIEGMVSEGVDDILIWDGHGAGGVCYEELSSPARLLHGTPLPPRKILDEISQRYDVCMMIGQHAMAGVSLGNLNHTQNQNAIDYYKLNGKLIGEIAQFTLYQGDLGLPMIFLTGDTAACKEAEELIAGVTTVSVKEGLSRGYAISLSVEDARRKIKEGVKKAIKSQKENPLLALRLDGPYVLEKRFFHSHFTEGYSGSNVELVDSQTVRISYDNIRDIVYA